MQFLLPLALNSIIISTGNPLTFSEFNFETMATTDTVNHILYM
jgi:hypothetical protein